jgi:hypothetical protein
LDKKIMLMIRLKIVLYFVLIKDYNSLVGRELRVSG